MDEENIIEIDDIKIKRMRNLKMFKDSTDDEIRAFIKAKEIEKAKAKAEQPDEDKDYDKRFKKKLDTLLDEFAVDMNNSNDREAIHNLVRQSLQLEAIDQQIRQLQAKPPSEETVKTLKALGDFQRSVQMSMNDIQDKLGISRKMRKDKASDDVPQFIDGILRKAQDFWQRKTVEVRCQTCDIELARYWLNFPDEANDVKMMLTCWKCREVVSYTGG